MFLRSVEVVKNGFPGWLIQPFAEFTAHGTTAQFFRDNLSFWAQKEDKGDASLSLALPRYFIRLILNGDCAALFPALDRTSH